jgi:hypothetical protein
MRPYVDTGISGPDKLFKEVDILVSLTQASHCKKSLKTGGYKKEVFLLPQQFQQCQFDFFHTGAQDKIRRCKAQDARKKKGTRYKAQGRSKKQDTRSKTRRHKCGKHLCFVP